MKMGMTGGISVNHQVSSFFFYYSYTPSCNDLPFFCPFVQYFSPLISFPPESNFLILLLLQYHISTVGLSWMNKYSGYYSLVVPHHNFFDGCHCLGSVLRNASIYCLMPQPELPSIPTPHWWHPYHHQCFPATFFTCFSLSPPIIICQPIIPDSCCHHSLFNKTHSMEFAVAKPAHTSLIQHRWHWCLDFTSLLLIVKSRVMHQGNSFQPTTIIH